MSKSVEMKFEGDEKSRRLRYDFNAIAELEEKLNEPIGLLLSENRVGMRALRGLIWAGLKWENRALTPEKVGELVQKHLNSGGSLRSLMEIATEALKLSGLFGKDEKEEEESEPDPKKETGES